MEKNDDITAPPSLGSRLWAAALFLLIGLAFWPIWNWLARSFLEREQLYTGAVVLVVAGAHHWMNRAQRVRISLTFGPVGLRVMLAAFVVLGVSRWFPPLALASACLALLAGILFLFGDNSWRPASKAVGVFTVFVLLIWLTPLFDWPLRKLAGQNVAWIFQQLGQDVKLALAMEDQRSVLSLTVAGKPYVVAPECNGFGILSSSLLLALVVLVLQRKSLVDKMLDLVVCLAAAFVANILRIVLIILLAPRVGEANYHVMHEAVGLLVFYGALGLMWLWLHPRGRPTSPGEAAAHTTPASTV